MIRDTKKSRAIKERYDYTCQLFNSVGRSWVDRTQRPRISDLWVPHTTGPTPTNNLICLCPNHHVLFDLGGFLIADDLTLIGIPGQLSMHATHKVNIDHIKYHREHYSSQPGDGI
jgi:putative restriction endonuclease